MNNGLVTNQIGIIPGEQWAEGRCPNFRAGGFRMSCSLIDYAVGPHESRGAPSTGRVL
jgi:hypothetical protein